ncbi:MAG: DUF58 domain-containing protein [Deltaproteobacteria bacterium]|jgi:uncharacterized protein (DUF58 family)|nr:DUF58 domain-containing protein [Deltaproteobacteria bacterium]
MKRPTSRLAWLFAISIPYSALLLAGFESPAFWALLYPALCLFLLALDIALGSTLVIAVTYDCPNSVPIGDAAKILLHIKATKKPINYKAFIEASLELVGELSDSDSPLVSAPMAEKALELTLTVTPKRRGRLIYKTLWLRWAGPMGLCHLGKNISLAGLHTDSVQSVKGLHDQALSFFLRETEPGLKRQPFRGEGSEFDSLMEYQPGMDNRFIDWKRSARHHKLLAKDFRQERNHQIILAFDTGRLMRDPVYGLPKLDHYIRSALLMAWVGLLSGDMVGAADFNLTFNAFLKPGRGAPFFSRLQNFTSGLNYSQVETNFAASLAELRTKVPHRSLIIFFTEFIDFISAEFMVDALGLLAKKHSVIFVCTPDPLLGNLRDKEPSSLLDLSSSVIADSFIRDRAIVLERVTRLGVQAIDAPPKALSSAILNRYLAIKQRGLL